MRLLPLLVAFPVLAATPTFTEHVVATDLRTGYQVVVADINRDGRPDLIALGSRMSELVWYQNPGWERHVLAAGQSRMINCTVAGDEIVLASGFENDAKDSAGIISVLHPGRDRLQPWSFKEIDRLPTSHRLRTADLFGDGHPVVINAPLTGAKASAPDYRDQTPLVYYQPGEWQRRVLSTENSGVVHGIFVTAANCLLTASFTGIHEFCVSSEGSVRRTELAQGDPTPWPKGGSSDVTIGHLGKTEFMAAIEPWHGTQVAIYSGKDRSVIEDSLVNGHTIQTGDFDGDGNDEIVVGFREGRHSVYLYQYDAASKRWNRTDLGRGEMGAAACAVADLNGDHKLDLACIDETRLKWYENR